HPGAAAGTASSGTPARSRAGGAPSPDVEALLAQMTLDEKIGQMTQVDKNALLRNGKELRELGIGSVLSGADSLPRPNAIDTWVSMYDAYQEEALGTHLRGIRRDRRAGRGHGRGGGARIPGRAGRQRDHGLREALPGRRRHHARQGP